MDQLFAVSEDQDIDFLYSLIRQDPDFFQAFDKKQFADTPLHFAAAEGRTALALEIQRLMPSFGTKLNPDGFSPLDVAMRRGQTDTVSAMVKLNRELAGVQGREGFTPLHYAAEIDDVNNLAMFLDCCPESIEALTIHGESAVHVAVKNGKFAAFKVLFGWLKRTDRTKMLLWRDLKGNNVLHLAASTNQPKIMELLIKECIPTNIMNSKGLTALDMIMELPPEVNGKALQILQRKGAKTGSSLNSHPQMVSSLATYLSSPITIFEKIFKFEVYLDIGLPVEMRNAILVVAALIVTTMYQTVLSPPGGLNDQTPVISNSSSTITNITSNIGHDRGNGTVLSMTKGHFMSFTLLNSLALGASVAMIFLVLPSRPYNIFLYISVLFLTMSYSEAMTIISPLERRTYVDIVLNAVFFILYLIVLVKGLLLPGQSYVRAKRETKGYYFYRRYEAITALLHSKYSCTNSDGKRCRV